MILTTKLQQPHYIKFFGFILDLFMLSKRCVSVVLSAGCTGYIKTAKHNFVVDKTFSRPSCKDLGKYAI